MARYQLLSGKHHAHGKIYLPGEYVELTAQEAQAFANKFQKVEEAPVPLPPAPFDLATASASTIFAALENGLITKEEVLAFERAKDKPRKSLLEALQAEG